MQEIIGEYEALDFWQKERELISHDQKVKNP